MNRLQRLAARVFRIKPYVPMRLVVELYDQHGAYIAPVIDLEMEHAYYYTALHGAVGDDMLSGNFKVRVCRT